MSKRYHVSKVRFPLRLRLSMEMTDKQQTDRQSKLELDRNDEAWSSLLGLSRGGDVTWFPCPSISLSAQAATREAGRATETVAQVYWPRASSLVCLRLIRVSVYGPREVASSFEIEVIVQ